VSDQPLMHGLDCAVFYVPANTVLVIWETVFTGQKTQPTSVASHMALYKFDYYYYYYQSTEGESCKGKQHMVTKILKFPHKKTP